MIIKPANRTNSVSEYYFSKKLQEIDLMNRQGAEVINLGIGAPDRMPPEEAILTLIKEAQHPGNHAYQSYKGIKELREGFATWYKKYYRVDLNPDTEIQPLAGSKEGILLLSLAFLNKGDQVLVPNPGYPTYSSASLLAEAGIVLYDLKEETGWMPDFEQLENRDLSRVKMMWTNYPNMPTGAKATMALYERLVEFGLKHRILICNDNPYSFILNDEQLSILTTVNGRIPAMSLQLIFENALKYNEITHRYPLDIDIYAEVGAVIVENSYHPRTDMPEASFGVGMESIQEIYRYYADVQPEYEIKEGKFICRLPLVE